MSGTDCVRSTPKLRRNFRLLANADHDVSGAESRVIRAHPKLAVKANFAHRLAAPDKRVPLEGPAQILLELSSEHGLELCIQEMVETPVLVQVVYESVG